MPEPTRINFTHKEVATALVKFHNLHEGIWGLLFHFGIRGVNVGLGDEDLQPSAIVPVMSMGLQRFDKLTNLSVDAAEVNPKPPRVFVRKVKRAKKR
jgi:hypothetical protein